MPSTIIRVLGFRFLLLPRKKDKNKKEEDKKKKEANKHNGKTKAFERAEKWIVSSVADTSQTLES